jgi:serine protease AprX
MLKRMGALFAGLAILAAIGMQGGATARLRVTEAFIDPAVLSNPEYQSVIVHLERGVSMHDGVVAARLAGAKVGTQYSAIGVFVAYGDMQTISRLAESRFVEGIESNARLSYLTNTSHAATRAEQVLNGRVKVDGRRVNGRGVGVAVVDSGVDGTHPDLASRMGGNIKIVCSTPQFVVTSLTGGFTECLGPKVIVESEDTDSLSAGGHGTHVAGIIAGTGKASKGRFHGAAPGATIYGISTGETLTVENALDGLAWVLENHDKVKPAIKVVNNSWGSQYNEYDPKDGPFHKATWKLQEALIAEGVTVVFAAGNAGGDGSEPTTTAECINPTPGLICVANYDDKNKGTRKGSIAPTSSRGKKKQPKNWPDLSAPGTTIVSTCRLTLPVCNAHRSPELDPPNLYATLSGTSMAAPHVSGIVALLYQVKPGLTPARVEDVLEDTAHKFDFGARYAFDPLNRDDKSSFDKGHGLVDALAAIRALQR